MPKKIKKKIISMHEAIIKSISQFIHEVNKGNVHEPTAYVFAVINEDNIMSLSIDMSDKYNLPTLDDIALMVKNGFKLKAKFVIFTIWKPESHTDIQSLDVIAYSKKERTTNKSYFRIVNNQLVPVAKQEKGFQIFLDDD